MRKKFLSLILLVSLVLSIIPALVTPQPVAAATYEAFHITGNEQLMTITAGSWQTKDLDNYFGGLGSDVSGVILHYYTSANYVFGVRKKGSSDALTTLGVTADVHSWVAIGVDANHQFEVYVGHATNLKVYVVGYTTWDSVEETGVYFYTNKIPYSPAGVDSWVTKDASSDAPGAIGLIFLRENTSLTVYTTGIRPYGSSFSTLYDITRANSYGVIIGCSEEQLIQINIDHAAVTYDLIGYVTAGAVFATDPTTLTVPSATWGDVETLPSGANMAFIQVGTTDAIDNSGFRRNGDSLAIYDDMRAQSWVMVGTDTGRIYEGYKGDTTNAIARRWGYAIPTEVYVPPLDPPTVETDPATDVTTTNSTLNGDLTSLGDYTWVDCYFEYGKTTAYELGATAPATNKTSTGVFNKTLTGLDTGSKYYFRAACNYSTNITYGAQADFTTLAPGAPTLETLAASSVGYSSVLLNGNITDMGGEGTVYVYFQYGKTPGFGSATSEQTFNTEDTFSQDIYELDSNTLYYFRAVLRYGASYVYGDTLDFTTELSGQGWHTVLPEELVVLASAGTWIDIDLDNYIDDLPLGVTGVVLKMWNPNGSDGCEYGLRKKGSTDNRIRRLTHTSNTYAIMGVDDDNIFQIYVETISSAIIRVYISGYTTTSVTFFTNAQLLNTATLGSWQTVSASAYVPSSATGLLFEIDNTDLITPTTAPGGLRMVGGTNDIKTGLSRHNSFFGIVGLDANRQFQQYRGSDTLNFWLIGYTTTGTYFYTTKINITNPTIGTWQDIGPLPEDGVMGFVEVSSSGDAASSFGLRSDGSTLDISNYPRYHLWAAVGVGDDKYMQGYRGTAISFWLVGYAYETEEGPILPAVTTMSASTVTYNSASLRADITTLGNYDSVVAGFEYGETEAFGSDSSNITRTSTGLYSIPITTLDAETLYYYRAKLTHDDGIVYGNTLTFSTLEEGNPSVSTGSADDTTTTGATLTGALEGLGDFSTVYVAFEYGKTQSCGTATAEQTMTAVGNFEKVVTGLETSTLYYFRARARGAGGDYVYGSTSSFTTSSIVVNSPSNFKVTGVAETSITLSWTKGAGTVNTLVMYDESAYPVSPSSGTQAYFGTSTSFTHSDREEDQTYYYSAWGEVSGTYSTSYATISGVPSRSGIAVPDTMLIESVEVYDDYLDGQLYVISYKLLYDETPTQAASEYFRFEIREGSILRATGPVTGWEYRPASIYLKGNGELTWEGEYTVWLVGLSTKWSTPPSTSYELSSSNWRGDDLTILDEWVRNLALRMQDYYKVELTTWYSTRGLVLNDQGAQIFRNAIPSLEAERPELFNTGGIVDVDLAPQDSGYSQELTAERNFGEGVLEKFTALGEHLNLSGTATAGVFWFIILLLIVIGGAAVTGKGEVGLIGSVPWLAAGGYLGLVPLWLIGVFGAILIVLFFANLWLART